MYKRLKRKLLKRLNGILGKKQLHRQFAPTLHTGGLFFILGNPHGKIKRTISNERKKESKR